MSDLLEGRSAQLDRALSDLLRQAPEVEAASVVSFDGLPMASALPVAMDENRVAAMSAALLSLGERAAEGLGRGELSQVYVEGESGTVFLISADDEAVLVAVGARGAKVGLLLYEIRRAAAEVGAVLRGLDVAADSEDEYELSTRLTAHDDRSPVAADEDAWRSEPTQVLIGGVGEGTHEDPHEPVVDEADPLGLGQDLADSVDSADAMDRDEPAESDDWPEPKPDLGAWASFSPGASSRTGDSSWS